LLFNNRVVNIPATGNKDLNKQKPMTNTGPSS